MSTFYVATWVGFVYVAFVIDVFARRIIGLRVARSMRAELVLHALKPALWSRPGSKGIVHHSDRGSQYLSICYCERLAEAKAQPSVGSVGDSYDNALAETIIGLCETDVIHRRGPGCIWTPWNTQRWNGSTDSITVGSWSRSAIYRRRRSRRRTIIERVSCRWRPDSNPEPSGKAGAVHYSNNATHEEVDMEDTKQQLDRRDFMGLAAAMAAIGMGAALPVATAAAAQGQPTDFTRWLKSINGKQRVLLDMREPNGGMALAWAWVWLFTAPQAYGGSDSDLGTVIVLRHNAIPVALDDSAWSKYKLGEYFKIDDPETKAPAERNPYYQKVSEPLIPDMALQNLIERGVKVTACDMAIHHYSGEIAKQMGLKHEDVKADWNAAVLPRITHAPSGIVACQGAVARGCTYLFAG